MIISSQLKNSFKAREIKSNRKRNKVIFRHKSRFKENLNLQCQKNIKKVFEL